MRVPYKIYLWADEKWYLDVGWGMTREKPTKRYVPEQEKVTGKIEDILEHNDKYGIKIDGVVYGTYSQDLQEKAVKLWENQKTVNLTYEKAGKKFNAISIMAIPEPPETEVVDGLPGVDHDEAEQAVNEVMDVFDAQIIKRKQS